MEETIASFQKINARLETFIRLVKNYSGSALERINEALLKIDVVVYEDTIKMIQIMNKFRVTFQEHIAYKVDTVIFGIEDVYKAIRLEIFVNSTNSEYSIANIAGQIEMLVHGLNAVETIERDSIGDTDHTPWFPTRFWANRHNATECEILFSHEAEEYSNLKENLISGESTSSALYAMIEKRQGNRDRVLQCVQEYKVALMDTLEVLETQSGEIQKTLNSQSDFKYDAALHHAQDELEYINENITRMAQNLASYSVNLTAKLELALTIRTDTMANMERKLQQVLAAIDNHAIYLILHNIKDTEILTQQWLINGLHAMDDLVVYFNNSNIDYVARQLNIWRRPFVALDTFDILAYTYDTSWPTWPRGTSMRQLLDSQTDVDTISDIISTYTNVLYDELDVVTMGYISAKADILSALEELVNDLDAFYQESLIDKDFIL